MECPVAPLVPLVPLVPFPGLNGLGGLKRMTELCKTRLPEGLLERAEKANTSDEAFKDLGELGDVYIYTIYIYIAYITTMGT